jgi:hypothetical protein
MTREELDYTSTILARRCLGDDQLLGALQALVRAAQDAERLRDAALCLCEVAPKTGAEGYVLAMQRLWEATHDR